MVKQTNRKANSPCTSESWRKKVFLALAGGVSHTSYLSFFYTVKFFGEKNLHRKTPIFCVKSVKKNATFSRKICKNLHRPKKIYTGIPLAPVTNIWYGGGRSVPKLFPFFLNSWTPDLLKKWVHN